MLDIAKPTDLIPIHGETYFLRKHVKFVREHYPQTTAHFVQNFDQVLINNDELAIAKSTALDPIIIHGDRLEIEREKVSERRKLACQGLIVAAINHKNKRILIETRGLPKVIEESIESMKELVHFTVFQENKNRDYEYTTEQVRIKLRNFARGVLGYKPITIIQMV